MVPTVLFVLLFINYIRGDKSCWKQLQSESDFYDVTLVCDDRRIQAHKFIISSYSPVFKKYCKCSKVMMFGSTVVFVPLDSRSAQSWFAFQCK